MDSAPDREQAIQKLADLIGQIRVAMLTTVTEDGALWSRPILTQRAHFDGDLWFISRAEATKIQELRRHRQVSLTYARLADNTYVSVSGKAQLVSDLKKVEQLWDPSYQRWFPGGPSDPGLALIRVHVERAEYWDAPPLTWPFQAGFILMEPEQVSDPQFHARIVFKKE